MREHVGFSSPSNNFDARPRVPRPELPVAPDRAEVTADTGGSGASLVWANPSVGSDGAVWCVAGGAGVPWSPYELDAGGECWIRRDELPSGKAFPLDIVSVADDRHVWAAGYDGAESALFQWSPEIDAWDPVPLPVGPGFQVNPSGASDGTLALLTYRYGGSERAVYVRRADGGWDAISGSETIYSVAAGRGGQLYAVPANDAQLLVRAGTTWAPAGALPRRPLYPKTYPRIVAAGADGSLLVLVSHSDGADWRMGLYLSVDGGASWKELALPPGEMAPNNVSIGDKDHIWLQGTGIYQRDPATGGWRVVLGVTIPAASAIAKVKENLGNLVDFVDTYHDYFQDHVSETFNLVQVSNADRGQAVCNAILSAAFKAVGAIPVPGAGAISAVLGGAFDYVIKDSGYDWNAAFADIWARLGKNSLELRRLLAKLSDDVRGSWTRALANTLTGHDVRVADLSESMVPARASMAFQSALDAALVAGRYQLFRDLVPRRWNRVHVTNMPELTFQSRSEAESFAVSYVDKNPNYRVTLVQKGSRWGATSAWLGYGLFPYGHHQPSRLLCERLFKDDGLGRIVRPDAVTTRADVFDGWGLPDQAVVIPSGPGGPIVSRLDRVHAATHTGLTTAAAARFHV